MQQVIYNVVIGRVGRPQKRSAAPSCICPSSCLGPVVFLYIVVTRAAKLLWKAYTVTAIKIPAWLESQRRGPHPLPPVKMMALKTMALFAAVSALTALTMEVLSVESAGVGMSGKSAAGFGNSLYVGDTQLFKVCSMTLFKIPKSLPRNHDLHYAFGLRIKPSCRQG